MQSKDEERFKGTNSVKAAMHKRKYASAQHKRTAHHLLEERVADQNQVKQRIKKLDTVKQYHA